MRALTVRQPWATAIVHLGKSPENRTRNIVGDHRGTIAIHASKGLDEAGFYDPLIAGPLPGYLAQHADVVDPFGLGKVIGVADLVSVHHDSDHGPPRCSPWAQRGLWHLQLTNPRALTVPVPCRGALGLWTLPVEVRDAVLEQLVEVSA